MPLFSASGPSASAGRLPHDRGETKTLTRPTVFPHLQKLRRLTSSFLREFAPAILRFHARATTKQKILNHEEFEEIRKTMGRVGRQRADETFNFQFSVRIPGKFLRRSQGDSKHPKKNRESFPLSKDDFGRVP